MNIKRGGILLASAALFLAAAPVAHSAQQPPAAQAPVTRAEMERALAAGDFVTKAELERFATKAEVAELRAQLEALRSRLETLKARLGVTTAPAALSPKQPDR